MSNFIADNGTLSLPFSLPPSLHTRTYNICTTLGFLASSTYVYLCYCVVYPIPIPATGPWPYPLSTVKVYLNTGMYIHMSSIYIYRIAGKFGGKLNLAVWQSIITTAKLKSAKISYSHIYVWRSRTEPPNLNPPIFFQ